MNDYGIGGVEVDASAVNCPVLVLLGEYDRTPLHSAQDVDSFY
jgi:hypothetical protein